MNLFIHFFGFSLVCSLTFHILGLPSCTKLNFLFKHFLFKLMQVMQSFIKMFHFLNLWQLWCIKTIVESSWNWWKFKLFIALTVRTKLELRALLSHDLLKNFLIQVKDIKDLYRPLTIKFQVVGKLFPNIFIFKNEPEEGHEFGEPPSIRGGFAFSGYDPTSGYDSPTFSFDLTLFNEVDSVKCGVFEKGFSEDSFREKSKVIIVNM